MGWVHTGHMSTAQSVWVAAGTTDEITDCEICGKTDLKGTVRMISDEAEVFAGSDCAARMAGRPAAEIRKAAAAANRAAHAARITARIAAAEAKQAERAAERQGLSRADALAALTASGDAAPFVLRALGRGDAGMWASYYDGTLG
jgi:hypothetical protein